MESNLAFLAARGVKLFRLDAFGYTTKRIGTSCFLVEPDVYRLLEWVNTVAHRYGAECLPEVHDHTSYQYPLSRRNMLIDNIDSRSADPIMRRSAANIHSVGAIYQLTCTFFDALMRNDDAYSQAQLDVVDRRGLPSLSTGVQIGLLVLTALTALLVIAFW